MANPVQPFLGDSAAIALGNIVHPGVGLQYPPFALSKDSAPTLMDHLNSSLKGTWDLLAQAAAGATIQVTPGTLTVDVFAIDYDIAGTAYSFAGGSIAVAASQTSYLYLDSSQTLQVATGAFPANVFRLAIIISDATQVTSITDGRFLNFPVGSTAFWYNLAAGGTVDFASNELDNLGFLRFADPTTLTIAAGAVTATQTFHAIAPEGGSFPDTLTTINISPDNSGRVVILTGTDLVQNITVDTAGLGLLNGDFLLNQGNCLGLIRVTISGPSQRWRELFRSDITLQPLIDKSTLLDLKSVKRVVFDPTSDGTTITPLQIIAGKITISNTITSVFPETGVSDDLDFIDGASDGQIAILSPRELNPDTITIRHNIAGNNNIQLSGGNNFVMIGQQSKNSHIVLVYDATLLQWTELSRSPIGSAMLVGTDNANYVPIPITLAGTLTVADDKQVVTLNQDCVIRHITGYANTAPAGAAAVIDLKVNGLSIFANQSEMLTIADGVNAGSSAVKQTAYLNGQTIVLSPQVAAAAADVTVVLHTYQVNQLP